MRETTQGSAWPRRLLPLLLALWLALAGLAAVTRGAAAGSDLVARFQAVEAGGVDAWGPARVGAPDAWSLTDGAGVVVAVLDTGVDAGHPALAGRVLEGWNFVSGTSDTHDPSGHGTYVAAIIAGRAVPGAPRDFSGMAPGAMILPVTILGPDGTGSTANFAAGIVYAVDRGASVINISASGVSPSPALLDALAYAETHQVVVVATVGNQPDGRPTYPATVPTVVAVAASDRDDRIASFSAYGPWVRLAAPGVDVVSAWSSADDGGGYRVASGTSAAAPFVAGAAALARAIAPDAPASLVRQALVAGARDLDAPGLDAASGAGLLDAGLTTRLLAPWPGAGIAQASIAGEGVDARLTFEASGFIPGEPVAAWLVGSDGAMRVLGGLAAAGDGVVRGEAGTLASVSLGAARITAVGLHSGHAARADVDITARPRQPAFQPVAPVESTTERRYFPETGHTLAHGFLAYWEANGGLAAFGYPISEEFSEADADTGEVHTVQYFERNRLEYHPEHAGTPSEVMLGRLGAESIARPFPAGPLLSDSPDRRVFAETGHTLSGPFLDYWLAAGGLARFGYPLSEPFEEGGRLVQYFERARFELHPDLPSEHRVLLSLLGVDLARHMGYLGWVDR